MLKKAYSVTITNKLKSIVWRFKNNIWQTIKVLRGKIKCDISRYWKYSYCLFCFKIYQSITLKARYLLHESFIKIIFKMYLQLWSPLQGCGYCVIFLIRWFFIVFVIQFQKFKFLYYCLLVIESIKEIRLITLNIIIIIYFS